LGAINTALRKRRVVILKHDIKSRASAFSFFGASSCAVISNSVQVHHRMFKVTQLILLNWRCCANCAPTDVFVPISTGLSTDCRPQHDLYKVEDRAIRITISTPLVLRAIATVWKVNPSSPAAASTNTTTPAVSTSCGGQSALLTHCWTNATTELLHTGDPLTLQVIRCGNPLSGAYTDRRSGRG